MADNARSDVGLWRSFQVPIFGIGPISVAALLSSMHMKSTSAFVLTALAATWAISHTKALGKVTSQPESFRAGGMRSFEIVPLETGFGNVRQRQHRRPQRRWLSRYCFGQGSSLAGAKPD